MRIHHLNCGTLRPLGGRFIGLEKNDAGHRCMVCHCLAIETDQGVVLVDAGFGAEDMAHPRSRLGGTFVTAFRPVLDPEETALRQLEKMGIAASDVRHIVLTHLDLDHAGGIGDFPDARIHVTEDEIMGARSPSNSNERNRYRACQWDHGPRWETYAATGESWKGFPCVQPLAGLPPEILLVPLAGHTRGHAGVAIDSDNGWVLHAGDAFFHRSEVDQEEGRTPWLLRVFQSLGNVHAPSRLANQARLQELAAREPGMRIVCAHDPVQWERLAGV